MAITNLETEVLIIGGGLSGMMAAWAAHQGGARVLLLDRNGLGLGTNSALSNGVLAAPTADYPLDQYIRETLEIGRRINRKSWLRLVGEEAPRAIEQLLSFGLEARETQEYFNIQAAAPEAIPGVNLVRKVAEQLRGSDRLHFNTSFYVTDILQDQGRAVGVRGIDDHGMEINLWAPAVILAAGGAGAIYLRNDNQKSILGQGYAMAARAGLALWDMEFVQFFPLVLAEPRLPALIVYPPFPREVKLIDAEGNDLSSLYGSGSLLEAVLQKRDVFSSALYARLENSEPVYLDYRSVPDSWWGQNPMKGMTKLKFDFHHTPIAVAPAAHFFMGGVRLDSRGETDLPGLYACGEMIWGLHGANRRGGNALTECLVSGLLAGARAARQSLGTSVPARPIENPRPPEYALRSQMELLRKLRKRLQEIAWQKAGVVRTGQGMHAGLKEIQEVEQYLQDLRPSNLPEQKGLNDLRSAALVVRAILTAGIQREESRGSFIRQDFPSEDDRRWLKNSRLTWQAAKKEFNVDYPEVEN